MILEGFLTEKSPLPTGQTYATPIVTKNSPYDPKGVSKIPKAVSKLFQSCTKVVFKLFQSCYKVFTKLFHGCLQVIPKLSKSFLHGG